MKLALNNRQAGVIRSMDFITDLGKFQIRKIATRAKSIPVKSFTVWKCQRGKQSIERGCPDSGRDTKIKKGNANAQEFITRTTSIVSSKYLHTHRQISLRVFSNRRNQLARIIQSLVKIVVERTIHDHLPQRTTSFIQALEQCIEPGN